jgi:hypothetical protein
MAKNQKRPVDAGGIYKDGTQKNQDDRMKLDDSLDSPKTPSSAKKRKGQ